jgi:hypothetical protein
MSDRHGAAASPLTADVAINSGELRPRPGELSASDAVDGIHHLA